MQNQGNTIKRRPAKKSMDTNVSKLREIMEDREAWHAAVHGVAKAGHNLATEQQHQRSPCVRSRKGERQGGGNGGGKAEQGGRSEPPARQPPRESAPPLPCSDKDREAGVSCWAPPRQSGQRVPGECGCPAARGPSWALEGRTSRCPHRVHTLHTRQAQSGFLGDTEVWGFRRLNSECALGRWRYQGMGRPWKAAGGEW